MTLSNNKKDLYRLASAYASVPHIVQGAGGNFSAQSATLPERIDIEGEKQRIKNAALTKLQQYDQTLNSGVSSIRPQDAAVNRSKAAALDTAGTAADNAFSYDASIPAQFQGTGPFASELPIFTFPGSRKQTARI